MLADLADTRWPARARRAALAGALCVAMHGRALVAQDAARPTGTVIASNMNDNTATVLDAATGRVLATLPTGEGESRTLVHVAAQPEGIAITPSGSAVWVGSNRDSVVLVVDVERRAVVDTLRGFVLPYRLAITPDSRLAVITDPATADVRVFDVATRRQRFAIPIARDSLVPTAETPGSPSPEGVTISRDSRWAFVTLQGRNRLATIDLERGRS